MARKPNVPNISCYCYAEKMATTKLAKEDFIVVISLVLIVILALRLGVKFTRSIETKNTNATNGCADSGYERKTAKGNYRWHEGYGDNGDGNDPKYPFFFWFYNKVGSTAISTAQKVIEKELEWYVRMLEKSPLIVSKEDQAEHNIVISCVDSASKKTKVHVCCKFKLALL